MTHEETPSAVKAIDPSLKYNPVFNRRKERVRGLWQRNGIYYAQVKVRGWTGQVPLHAKTVADAVAARQVLKTEIKSGKFLTPLEQRQKEEKAEKVSTEVSIRTIRDAITQYQSERNTLAVKDPKTFKCEDSRLKSTMEACHCFAHRTGHEFYAHAQSPPGLSWRQTKPLPDASPLPLNHKIEGRNREKFK